MKSSLKFTDLGEDFFAHVKTQNLENTSLIHVNEGLMKEMNFKASKKELLSICSGEKRFAEQNPVSTVYAGHQFGYFVPQLGDGRSCLIGEVNGLELSLKGAGTSPFSRGADGRAVLRSSIREYLCSIAMQGLSIPTTRALAIVRSNTQVYREHIENAAIVTRVAESHIRFGHFEYFASQGQNENVKKLADFVIKHYMSDLEQGDYLALFKNVIESTAIMIARWQAQGFSHGVMNTDNMSILGLTIDYGPYGWLDNYDPHWTPNTTDAQQRRYRFGNQPSVAHWNLLQLANALYPLVGEVEPLEEALEHYSQHFEKSWSTMMAAKLGLPSLADPRDSELAESVLTLLQSVETDMTIFWRELANVDCSGSSELLERGSPLLRAVYNVNAMTVEQSKAFHDFADGWAIRQRDLNVPIGERTTLMNQTNPKYVLRNYMAQLAIDEAEQGDFGLIAELLELVRSPYADQPDKERFYSLRPEWARTRVGCSQLSCSS